MLHGKTGVGHRREIGADLLLARDHVDFVEVVAETCFAQASTRREAAALAAVWPVVPHGVKLSLGSADGIDPVRIDKLAALCREVRAPLVSEHVAITRGGACEIGHLTQLPRSRAALAALARNVATARRRLPDIPLLLENVAENFSLPAALQEMDEPTFYQEVVRVTGCELLLDVGNLYANAVNAGHDPQAVLARYPVEHVAMVHVAGGLLEDGFYFDTHADPVPEPVYDLVGAALARRPDAAVLLERDGAFSPFSTIAAELARLRRLRDGAPPASRVAPSSALPAPSDVPARALAALAAEQAALAELLVATEPDASHPLWRAIGTAPLERARGVLARKRVDDALPLLPRLAEIAGLRPLAEEVTRTTRRVRAGAGPADAMAIARAALADVRLAEAAASDLLLLEARFVVGPSGARPRRAPFLRRAATDGLWAWKSFGAFSAVHVHGAKAASLAPLAELSPSGFSLTNDQKGV